MLLLVQFMTLRRLNIEIQGFPESYATAPQLSDNRVVGEPHPYALGVVSDVPAVTPLGPSDPALRRASPTATTATTTTEAQG